MQISVNYCGVNKHLGTLEQERKVLLKLKESLEKVALEEEIDYRTIRNILDNVERLLKSVERKRYFLQDVVSEWKMVQFASKSELDNLTRKFETLLQLG